LVEHNLAKVGVAGSSPVSRSGTSVDAAREILIPGRFLFVPRMEAE